MVPDPTPLFPSLCILDEDEEASVAMGEEDEVLEFDGCTTSIVRMSFIVSRYSYARARWRMEVDGRSMLDGVSYRIIIDGACVHVSIQHAACTCSMAGGRRDDDERNNDDVRPSRAR